MNDRLMEAAKKISEHCNLGILLYEQKNYTKALQHFEKALSVIPLEPRALIYRSICRIILAETIEEARQAVPDLERGDQLYSLALKEKQASGT